MLRMVNLLMALSLGVHREQLLQRMGLTWPRPFLLRPLFFLYRCEYGQPLRLLCWWVQRWVLEMGFCAPMRSLSELRIAASSHRD